MILTGVIDPLIEKGGTSSSSLFASHGSDETLIVIGTLKIRASMGWPEVYSSKNNNNRLSKENNNNEKGT